MRSSVFFVLLYFRAPLMQRWLRLPLADAAPFVHRNWQTHGNAECMASGVKKGGSPCLFLEEVPSPFVLRYNEYMHYLYLLYSQSLSRFYIGVASNLDQRLGEHNRGNSPFTRKGIPWKF